jgi:hypothetical protein
MFCGVDPRAKWINPRGMIRPTRAFLAFLVLAPVAARAADPDETDESTLRRMNGDYVRAYLASDIAKFRAMLADDFTGVLASG